MLLEGKVTVVDWDGGRLNAAFKPHSSSVNKERFYYAEEDTVALESFPSRSSAGRRWGSLEPDS